MNENEQLPIRMLNKDIINVPVVAVGINHVQLPEIFVRHLLQLSMIVHGGDQMSPCPIY